MSFSELSARRFGLSGLRFCRRLGLGSAWARTGSFPDDFPMSEHAAIHPPPEIVLSREPAFRLAATDVRPAELEIEGPAGVRALEPRVMKVLVALHRGLGAAVSREAL